MKKIVLSLLVMGSLLSASQCDKFIEMGDRYLKNGQMAVQINKDGRYGGGEAVRDAYKGYNLAVAECWWDKDQEYAKGKREEAKRLMIDTLGETERDFEEAKVFYSSKSGKFGPRKRMAYLNRDTN